MMFILTAAIPWRASLEHIDGDEVTAHVDDRTAPPGNEAGL